MHAYQHYLHFLWCLLLFGCAQGQNSQSITTFAPNNNIVTAEVVNRITWGANESSLREANKLGLDRYLAQQLHPKKTRLPDLVQKQIDEMTISKKSMEQLIGELELERKQEKLQHDEKNKTLRKEYQQELTRLGNEAATRSLLRDIYSPNQLQEQMTWFWMNHFNVHEQKQMIRAMIGDYEEQAIRPYALGKFRDLLFATSHHPAMLAYLDNEKNAMGHLNENYAREIMELHTLGVAAGYTQKDVQELARILTGVGISHGEVHRNHRAKTGLVREGLFEFNPKRHDYGDKQFLGKTIKGSGLAELDEALNLLASHPATAHFISRKLALYFVSDNPSPALIDAMAERFIASNGDIAKTLEYVFASDEFAKSLNQKFKDPIHYVNSAMRLAYSDNIITNSAPLLNWLNRMGEPLYGKPTPDGYALTENAWASPGQMTTRFEIAKAIGNGNAELFKADDLSKTENIPNLKNSFYTTQLQNRLSETTNQLLSQTRLPQEWNLYLLAAPEFMQH